VVLVDGDGDELQHAGLRPVRWELALKEFLARLEDAEVKRWLLGSGALAVRGLDVAPRDLDFAVSVAGAVGRFRLAGFHDR
jgi:hypothetical protein